MLSVLLAGLLVGQSDPAHMPIREAPVSTPLLTAKIFYPAAPTKRAPAILVLGGAEGGSAWAEATARMLAEHGFVAMAEAFFKAPGLPPKLQRVPLERFRAGLDRLSSDPRVDSRRIGIVGLSKGAEAALLTASGDSRVKAVVAGSPSDVVWQGIDREPNSAASSWTRAGEALPFVSFAPCTDCKGLADLYTRSRTTRPHESRIPVERIGGPILMIASRADAVWPSETMADQIAATLTERQFPHAVSILRYPEGGHFTLGAPAPEDADADAGFGGGTPKGVVAARKDSWPRILSFLDGALRVTDKDQPGTPARSGMVRKSD